MPAEQERKWEEEEEEEEEAGLFKAGAVNEEVLKLRTLVASEE